MTMTITMVEDTHCLRYHPPHHRHLHPKSDSVTCKLLSKTSGAVCIREIITHSSRMSVFIGDDYTSLEVFHQVWVLSLGLGRLYARLMKLLKSNRLPLAISSALHRLEQWVLRTGRWRDCKASGVRAQLQSQPELFSPIHQVSDYQVSH